MAHPGVTGVDDLLARADTAMYTAKREGGGRIALAGTATAPVSA